MVTGEPTTSAATPGHWLALAGLRLNGVGGYKLFASPARARALARGGMEAGLRNAVCAVASPVGQVLLSELRTLDGEQVLLQRRFSSTDLSSNRFPTCGFTGTRCMVRFDRERKVYPSPQTRRSPPAHGRCPARAEEPAGGPRSAAALIDVRRRC
jgi:hypothetical protein